MGYVHESLRCNRCRKVAPSNMHHIHPLMHIGICTPRLLSRVCKFQRVCLFLICGRCLVLTPTLNSLKLPIEFGNLPIFRIVTFICGKIGVYALGAVVAKQSGDEQLCQHYLNEFSKITLPKELPNELLYGRAGFLWACSFLNKYIGKDAISSTRMRAVVDQMIKSGRQLGNKRCPLMFEWHGKRYWGAAHGLAGIMHVLMDMDLKPDEVEDVKSTIRYMIKNRFPSGNYPSSEESESDRLVHWCHGAPGVALTLVKAAQVFDSKEFLEAAIDAGEVVWNRGLLKRVGLCHGISGNAYVFLALYRLTGKMEYLYRAKAFACFLHDRAPSLISEGIMHGGDRPYSLFEGIGGMAYLFLDMAEPNNARFPAYEL